MPPGSAVATRVQCRGPRRSTVASPLAWRVPCGAGQRRPAGGGRSRGPCPSPPRRCLLQTRPRHRACAASSPAVSSSRWTLFTIIFKMSLFRRSAEPAPALSLPAASVAPPRLRWSPRSSPGVGQAARRRWIVWTSGLAGPPLHQTVVRIDGRVARARARSRQGQRAAALAPLLLLPQGAADPTCRRDHPRREGEGHVAPEASETCPGVCPSRCEVLVRRGSSLSFRVPLGECCGQWPARWPPAGCPVVQQGPRPPQPWIPLFLSIRVSRFRSLSPLRGLGAAERVSS